MSNATRYATWIKKFFVFRTTHGGPPLLMWQPTAASQTITRGDPVTISSSAVSLGAANSGAIYGVAAGDVTTTAADEGTTVPIWVADRSNIFVGVANAASSGIEEGAECDIAVSSGAWSLNIGASTEGVAEIVQHVEGDSTSDSTYYGRLEFVWKRSQYDNLVAAK